MTRLCSDKIRTFIYDTQAKIDDLNKRRIQLTILIESLREEFKIAVGIEQEIERIKANIYVVNKHMRQQQKSKKKQLGRGR